MLDRRSNIRNKVCRFVETDDDTGAQHTDKRTRHRDCNTKRAPMRTQILPNFQTAA